MRSLLAAVTFALLSASVFAAPRTVTLQVSGMVCPLCATTVKKALQKVDGVLIADVSLERKEAVVTFDDAQTSEQALMRATGNAGFPSIIKAK